LEGKPVILQPDPPLNEHGRLAVSTADVQAALVDGLTGGCCVCQHSTIWWWPAADGTFHPLHSGCARRLLARWAERVESGDVDTPAVVPEVASAALGAYARRARATGGPAALAPPRATRTRSRSLGSPYFRPGMPEGSPHTIVARTAEEDGGQLLVIPTTGAHNAAQVLSHYAALTLQGRPYRLGGPRLAGAAVVDPTGAIVQQWGQVGEVSGVWPL
jgi:hypothetical protein